MTGESKARRMFAWAELPARQDIYTWKGTTKWGNHDLYPIDPKERTFGSLGFFAIWTTNCVSISTFTTGSTYIAYGLTAGQVIGGTLLGGCISSVIAYFASRPGMDYNVGYTIMNRPAYGMWGTTVPLVMVFLGGTVFSGLQAYYGGQAVALILSSIIPQFQHMPNTLPLSASITTQNLIGFVIYMILLTAVIFFVPPHKLRYGLFVSFGVVCATMIGLLAWAVKTNGGHVGSLISSPVQITASQRAFRVVQCISSISGSYGGAADRISDWTRFEKKRGAALPAMIITLPVSLTISVLFGVLVTTATQQIYGEAVWNPLTLLQTILTDSYNPGPRAGAFFAGFGLLISQLVMNMSQNIIPYGMDLAGLFPRYLSMRRACLMLVVLMFISQPWRFFTQAYILVTILSGITLFFAASIPIVLLDFWVVRKRTWNMPDLFKDGPEGLYWFTGGWNFRALATLILAMAPCIPGFIWTCIDSEVNNAAIQMYQITYFIVAPLAAILYLSFNWFWPIDVGVKEFIPGPEETDVLEGLSVDNANKANSAEFQKAPASEVKSAQE